MTIEALTRGRPLAILIGGTLVVYVLGMTVARFLFWPGFVLITVSSVAMWYRLARFLLDRVKEK